MEWRALPPVDWWIVVGGFFWSIFWVTAVALMSASLSWIFLYLIDRSEALEVDPLQIAGKRYPREEISHAEIKETRGHLRDTFRSGG